MKIKDIKEIKAEGNKILHLIYGDRKFVLKTDTVEQFEIWKNAITILKIFWNDEKNRSEDEESDPMKNSLKGKKDWKMKNIEQETLKAIINEKESSLFS